jgi:predicted outer membrane repeat protein
MGTFLFSNNWIGWGKMIVRLSTVILLSALLLQPSAAVQASTNVCGPVGGTWDLPGSPYIVTCDVQILAGTTLTINPGVVVKFNTGFSMQVNGTLIAREATFTSNKAVPTKGDWKQILFTASSADAIFDAGGNYLSGSVIQNNLIELGGGAGVNGAVETSGSSPFLDQNTIRNHNASGIYAVGRSSGAPVVIRNNILSNNTKTGDGGGIYASSGLMTYNTANGNSATNGGGIYASNSSLTGNNLTQNATNNGSGGGIYASGSTLTGNTVSNNSARFTGGGIYSQGSTLSENLVTGNVNNNGGGTAYGGGIYASGGSLSHNIVRGNTARSYEDYYNCHSASGGGIYANLAGLTNNTVENNVVSGCTQGYGGGIYSISSNLSGNDVHGNSVVPGGANIGYGGGIYANGGTISQNDLSNNSASGGIDNQGGGIYSNAATVSNNTLTTNSANRGGAIYALKSTVNNNTITNNSANQDGALYMNEGSATGNTLTGNSAFNGGGIYGYKTTLTGNTLTNNIANQGGGIYSSINTTVNGNNLAGNAAQNEGGGIYADGGTVTYNTLTTNTAPSYGHGSGAYLLNTVNFTYNNVTGNTAPGGAVGGVAVNGTPVLQYNNLYSNVLYDLEIISTGAVDATLNYWGQVACLLIPNRIYDGNDMPGRGIVTYAPSLYSQLPLDQMSIPANLALQANGSLVTLNWDPLPALPDVGCKPPGYTGSGLGYKVYYDTDDSCPPFVGEELVEGPSPIDASSATSLTLHGLVPKRYYFTVTVYDYLSRQSAFSNVEVRIPHENFLPLLKR